MFFLTIEERFPLLTQLGSARALTPGHAHVAAVVAITAEAPDALPRALPADTTFHGDAAALLAVRAARARGNAVVTLGPIAARVARAYPDARVRIVDAQDAPVDVPDLLVALAHEQPGFALPGVFASDVAPRLMASMVASAHRLATAPREPLRFVDEAGWRWAPVTLRAPSLELHGAVVVHGDGLVRVERSALDHPDPMPAAPASWLVASAPNAKVLAHLRLPPLAIGPVAARLLAPPSA